jgi:hypothetical protein
MVRSNMTALITIRETMLLRRRLQGFERSPGY